LYSAYTVGILNTPENDNIFYEYYNIKFYTNQSQNMLSIMCII